MLIVNTYTRINNSFIEIWVRLLSSMWVCRTQTQMISNHDQAQ